MSHIANNVVLVVVAYDWMKCSLILFADWGLLFPGHCQPLVHRPQGNIRVTNTKWLHFSTEFHFSPFLEVEAFLGRSSQSHREGFTSHIHKVHPEVSYWVCIDMGSLYWMMCTCFDSGRQQFEYQREEVKMKRPFTQASGSRKSVNCVCVCVCACVCVCVCVCGRE